MSTSYTMNIAAYVATVILAAVRLAAGGSLTEMEALLPALAVLGILVIVLASNGGFRKSTYRTGPAFCLAWSVLYCATPYGALVEGRAKCDGTAKTAQWILERLGMVVMSVSGDPMDGEIGHQWNVIEINGTFYDLDVTADLGTETDKLLYGRFNVNDRLIRDIYPIRSSYQTCFTVPGTSSTAGSYHARNHTLVASGADYGPMLADLISRATQSGGGSFSIQFSSKTQMDEMLQIFESWDRANQFLKEYGASLDGFSYSQHYQAESYVCSLTLTWYQ